MIDFADEAQSELEGRVIALEEILAARWPRRVFLRRGWRGSCARRRGRTPTPGAVPGPPRRGDERRADLAVAVSAELDRAASPRLAGYHREAAPTRRRGGRLADWAGLGTGRRTRGRAGPGRGRAARGDPPRARGLRHGKPRTGSTPSDEIVTATLAALVHRYCAAACAIATPATGATGPQRCAAFVGLPGDWRIGCEAARTPGGSEALSTRRVVKAAAIVLAVLLVLAHPAAAVAVLAVELAACAVLTGLIVRALRPLCVPADRHRRAA